VEHADDLGAEKGGAQRRSLGLLTSFAITAGSMVGIGIFLSPPMVARSLPSLAGYYGMWLLGGLIALSGAVACGELGAMLPRAGGDYVFQREAYGGRCAFASGWVLFGAIFAGSIATLSVALFQFQVPALTGMDTSVALFEWPWGGALTLAHALAVAAVLVFTGVNHLGAHVSGHTQLALALLPIGAYALLGLGVLLLGPGAEVPPDAAAPAPLTLGGFAVAYMAVYFAYSGWNNVIYVAGEVKDPARNIPRALIAGTAAITLLYLLMCAAFVHVLALPGVAEAGEVGTASADAIGGRTARWAVTALIGFALLATVNATVLGGARVGYAMGLDGAASRWLGDIDPASGAPARALWAQAAWAVLLIVSGRFEQLYQMVSLAMVLTGALTVGALFVLRRTRPDHSRPYRATGYPWLPAIYLLASAVVMAIMVARAFGDEPGTWYPLLGVGIFALAFALRRP